MKKDGKLYVIYHNPCLDGIYSLTGLMLPIITKIKKDGWKIQDYLTCLRKRLVQLQNEQEKPKQNDEKYQSEKEYDNEPIENNNMGFFYGTITDVLYMPITITQGKDEVQNIIKYLKEDTKQSILIIVDYFGKTWDNLINLTKYFEYVIVIDHHSSCVSAIPNYEKERFSLLNKVEGVENLFMLVNIDKAACLLVQDFHEQMFQSPYTSLIPKNIASKFLQFTKHVSDNDLFVLNYPETEPMQMAIMNRKYNFDIRLTDNIMYKLLEMDFNFLVKEGQRLAKIRNDKVEMLVKKRKTIVFEKGIVGYALECGDLSIVNSLGNALGIMAMRSGDLNLGAVYHEDKSNSMNYKIHLRSAHHDEQGKLLERYRCDILAEKYGGGGHGGAASFFMNKKEWNKRMFQ